MKKRVKMTKSRSRKNFKRGAVRVHKKNMIRDAPMRGGIRL